MDDELSAHEMAVLKQIGLDTQPAQAARLPWKSGDGYSFGGGAIVTIGSIAIDLGEGDNAMALAKEIARRWNAGI